MSSKFKEEAGDWTPHRKLPDSVEVDLHRSDDRPRHGPRDVPYRADMLEVEDDAFEALVNAQQEGKQYVLFTHGRSTSGFGKTTARSVIRGLMRSTAATPYIVRKECIQHPSVFVAAIRPRADS